MKWRQTNWALALWSQWRAISDPCPNDNKYPINSEKMDDKTIRFFTNDLEPIEGQLKQVIYIYIYEEWSRIIEAKRKRYLAFHWIGIDLTHVGSGVFLLDVLYQELPHGRAGTSFDWNARILSYHFVIDGLDRLGICFHPTDLSFRCVVVVSRTGRTGGHTDANRENTNKWQKQKTFTSD